MYKVKINDSRQFEITQNELEQLDVIETQSNKFHILIDHQSVEAELLESDFNNKTYTISINNNNYDVSISDDLDLLIEKMGFATSASKQIDKIEAPMPGLILELNVKAGDDVEENDNLLILEAMKMENVITSPRQGKIKSVVVSKGDAVDKKSLLIEFE
ncbi:MAG: acetyl-CoA carboxylase biotin carboxyl carrier protein subunit [Winogradskyella sp.]|nr:acetyl-CoA carboxylase biotin carboxyl carrier protein subunit [Winogradskyella sp.]NNC44686.1 acetyl-CoA carboxylase biotin carboxyl carrier protein subunit [Winogradskyella sp.]NNF85996.1 acetyl-CoA carboxylase biotin carboxyl carrier protein subunit [Winogradskyella sp.]